MASTLAPLQPLPTPVAQMADPKTGLIRDPWYQYLRQLDAHIRDIERRLTAGSL